MINKENTLLINIKEQPSSEYNRLYISYLKRKYFTSKPKAGRKN